MRPQDARLPQGCKLAAKPGDPAGRGSSTAETQKSRQFFLSQDDFCVCGLDQHSEDRRPRWAGDLFQQVQIPQTIQM